MKSDGAVGVSGNYNLTVNKLSKLDGYPIPNIDDLYTKLAGGQPFTELDFSHAYEQMLVDDDSRELFTISTHRLPYGVSSAPGIFQRTTEGLLQGIPSTGVLLDKILISGSSTEVHLDNVEKVLERLSVLETCHQLLGDRVDAEGFHPIESKVEAIKATSTPTNTSELKSFQEMLNFYGKFLPTISSTLEPL